MPRARASVPGAISSAAPRAMLNQPRPRAMVSPPSPRPDGGTYPNSWYSMVSSYMGPSLWLDRDLDAAVLLVPERLVHLGGVVDGDAVGDHEGGIDLALLDAVEQVVRPAVHVGLARAHGEPLLHEGPEGDLVHEAPVDAGDGQRAAGPADVDHLAQDVRAVALHHGGPLHAVVDGVEGAGGVGLQAHGVDALLRPLAPRQLVEPFDHALLLDVDGDGAPGPSHGQPLGDAVDRHHLLRPQEDRAADAELADRAGPPDSDGVLGLDVALDGGLPARREDVAQEQHLLVRE